MTSSHNGFDVEPDANSIERPEILHIISALLSRSTCVSIHGTTGSGKTQVCFQFARKFRNNYDVIFRFDVSSSTAFRKSIEVLAAELSITLKNTATDWEYLLQVNLRCEKNFLFILDNVPPHSNHQTLILFDVKPYKPPTKPLARHFLLVSNDKLPDISCQSVRLEGFTLDQARRFLASRTGIESGPIIRQVFDAIAGHPLRLAHLVLLVKVFCPGDDPAEIVQFLGRFKNITDISKFAVSEFAKSLKDRSTEPSESKQIVSLKKVKASHSKTKQSDDGDRIDPSATESISEVRERIKLIIESAESAGEKKNFKLMRELLSSGNSLLSSLGETPDTTELTGCLLFGSGLVCAADKNMRADAVAFFEKARKAFQSCNSSDKRRSKTLQYLDEYYLGEAMAEKFDLAEEWLEFECRINGPEALDVIAPHYSLGVSYFREDNYINAKPHFVKIVEIGKIHHLNPEKLMNTHAMLCHIYFQEKEFENSVHFGQLAIPMKGYSDIDEHTVRLNVSIALANLKQYQESNSVIIASLPLFLASKPLKSSEIEELLLLFGRNHCRLKDYEQAQHIFDELIKLQVTRQDVKEAASTCHEFSSELVEAENWDKGIKYLQQSYDLLKSIGGLDECLVDNVNFAAAHFSLKLGDLPRAMAFLDESRSACRKLQVPIERLAHIGLKGVRLLMFNNYPKESSELGLQLVKDLKAVEDRARICPILLDTLEHMAKTCMESQDFEQASKFNQEAIELQLELGGPNSLRLGELYFIRYFTSLHSHDATESFTSIEKCVAIFRIHQAIVSPVKMAQSLQYLGRSYSTASKFESASKYLQEATQIFSKLPEDELPNDQAMLEYYLDLGTVYVNKMEFKNAERAYENALRLHKRGATADPKLGPAILTQLSFIRSVELTK